MQGGEAVWDKPPKPERDVEYVVIVFFLVHCGHYLVVQKGN